MTWRLGMAAHPTHRKAFEEHRMMLALAVLRGSRRPKAHSKSRPPKLSLRVVQQDSRPLLFTEAA